LATRGSRFIQKGYSVLEASVAVGVISLIILVTTMSLRTTTVNEDALAKSSITTIEEVQHRSMRLNGTYASAADVMNSSTPLNGVTAVSAESGRYDAVSVFADQDSVTLAAKAKKDCWILKLTEQPTPTTLARTWFLVRDYNVKGYVSCTATMQLPPTALDMDNGPSTPHLL